MSKCEWRKDARADSPSLGKSWHRRCFCLRDHHDSEKSESATSPSGLCCCPGGESPSCVALSLPSRCATNFSFRCGRNPHRSLSALDPLPPPLAHCAALMARLEGSIKWLSKPTHLCCSSRRRSKRILSMAGRRRHSTPTPPCYTFGIINDNLCL